MVLEYFFLSNNGSCWTAVNNGLTSTAVFTLAINENNIYAGTYVSVFLICKKNSLVYIFRILFYKPVCAVMEKPLKSFIGIWG